jgi:hypothetical protein
MELNARAYRQATSEGLSGESLAARIKQIVQDPPPDIRLEAIDMARYQTFTNELTGSLRQMQKLAQYPALKVIVPFIKTPTNIMRFFFERTPLAPFAQSVRADIAAGGARKDLALARMSMGSSIMGISAIAAANGQITGGGPTDHRLRKFWLENNQPYSMRIGDTWYAYGRLEPLGTLLGVAADFQEIAGEASELQAGEVASKSIMATAKNITSKTFLRGISETIRALEDPDRYGDRYIQNFLGTVVPTGVAQVARVKDPTLREVQSVMDKIKSRIPGYSETLPPRLNMWGEPIILQGGLGPDIMSPIYTHDIKEDRLGEEILSQGIPISMPSKTIFGTELEDPSLYNRYIELSGKEKIINDQSLKGALNELIRSPLYKDGSDGPEGGKSYLIRNTVQAYRGMAQGLMLEEFPELRRQVESGFEERAERLSFAR